MGRTANVIQEYARRLSERVEPSQENIFRPPIAISREVGSGGGKVAEALAVRLGFKCCDRCILDTLAVTMHASPENLNELDERPVDRLALFGSSFFTGCYISRTELDNSLKQTVRKLLDLGSIVVLGRGAVFLAEPGRALRLRITAPFDLRVAEMMRRYSLARKQAETKVHQIDLERLLFHKRMFGMYEGRSESYDLAINLQQLTTENAVEIAVGAYSALFGEVAVSSPAGNAFACSGTTSCLSN
jgi:CMP/dCMP kinase